MCGIVGRINFDGAPVIRAEIDAARDALANRGPDGAGTWIDGAVGLAHRRLAILDLSPRGAQPMHDAGGQAWITYNGEVFNFRELRDELAALGHAFSSTSDTEVMLAAYRQWGIACVKRFNGMFAFALWDGVQKKLYLVRDRCGVKPLYYAHLHDKVIFASTLGPFAAFADFPLALDHQALDLYFQMSYVPAPLSIYRDIRKVRPGTWIEITANGQARETIYWQPAALSAPATETEALDELESRLRSSIQYRLISDVPVGAFLSGGIDSSLVVALMRSFTPAVKTFTIGFTERAHDESPYALAIARHLGTEHTQVTVTPAYLLELADTLPRHYDEPFADASAIPTLALAHLTRQHVTVALSGDGGDELFGGYPYYGYLRRMEPLRRLAFPTRALLKNVAAVMPGHRMAMGLRALAQPDTPSLFAYMRGPLKTGEYGDLMAQHKTRAGEFLARRLAEGGGAGDLVGRYMDLDLRTYLPDDILVKVDRASMAYGLEARTPFLDYRVVEYARALPLALRTHGHGGKYLLRKLLARHLPPELFERPKHGFTVPIRAWFRAELHAPLEACLRHGELVRSGFMRAAAVDRLVTEHTADRRNHENILWAMFMFEKWHAHSHATAPHRH
jgi:asparagine synthase (glutamine-hydrolysing)